MTVTVGVLQPGYLPWLGFFDLIDRTDVFVLYDDVQYDKHGWRNRNRIKTATGPRWLTVPVHHGHLGSAIVDVRIDNQLPWARKHVRSLRQSYARAPYAERYLPDVEAVLAERWERLVDLDIALVELLCGWLGLEGRVVRSSTLGIRGRRNERLLAICRHFEATRYLTGNAARAYLDVPLFERHGIEVEWQSYLHPVYPQLHGPFEINMSALDLLLNCGDESGAILTHAIEPTFRADHT